MSSRTLFVVAPVALGVAVLAWPLLKAKGDPAPALAKRARPAKVAPASKVAAATETAPAAPAEPRRSAPPASDPTAAAIQSRVTELEARLRELEGRRDALAAENDDLQRQATEKAVEASARVMAEWRVRSWETLLGLSESQKRELLDLATRWWQEDRGRPVAREVWASREGELRSRLTAEQAARLNEQTSTQAVRQWSMMGRTLGSMVGASKEEQGRLQQAVGSFTPPSAMLLPEAHGADWAGLSKEAAARIRPILTTEQAARLDQHVRRD